MKSAPSFFHYDTPWWNGAWKWIALVVLILGIFVGSTKTSLFYRKTVEKKVESSEKIQIILPTVAPYPVNTSNIFPNSEITATGVIVYDIPSGVYLYKRNADELLSPASTTKIMTALVSLDAYNLSDVVTIDKPLKSGQIMGLYAGEQITVENLLYGSLIHSGNDAAKALADYYPGGYDAFISAMNKKAADLHMAGTTFTNSMGFDDPNHKMTPIDLVRLAEVALENPTIAKMVAIPQITVSDITHTHYHKLTNVNELLGKIPGVAGIKTGWTEEAGENLVTYLDRDGRKLIFVVLRSKDRFADTIKLIDWVFANYYWETYASNPPSEK